MSKEVIFLISGAFLGAIIGGFFSWLITHLYYKKSLEDQKKSSNELICTIKNMNDKQFDRFKKFDNSKIAVKELNKLIEEKTFDVDACEKGEPLPYFACPKCGCDDLEKSGYDNGDMNTYTVKCKKCGWSQSCGG